jgi:predicted dienelactone hydrolase
MGAIKLLRGLILLAVIGFAVLLGSIWLDHTRKTTLFVPTGPFAVGRTIDVWRDEEHSDGTRRELVAWIWYPAAPQQSSQTFDDYLPAPLRAAVDQQRGKVISRFLTRDLSRVRTHSMRDAELSPQQLSYPVVLMRAGLSGLVAGYSSLAEDLASHGYVVVGFDAPYLTSVVVFPDGTVIAGTPGNDADLVQLVRAWSADAGFALDQLERLNESDPSGRFLGRLDMTRVGVFGHSLGGATALQFCHDDSRCKAGIDVDGAPLGSVIAEGVTQPFMFLLSDHSSEPDAETRPIHANIRAIYERLPSDRRWLITIRGGNHYMFSDDGAMLKSPLIMRALRTLGIVHIDGRRQIAVTTHYISTFFDVYLHGAPASNLKDRAGYTEVEYIH